MNNIPDSVKETARQFADSHPDLKSFGPCPSSNAGLYFGFLAGAMLTREGYKPALEAVQARTTELEVQVRELSKLLWE